MKTKKTTNKTTNNSKQENEEVSIPHIRLNRAKRIDLKKFAQEVIGKKASETDLGKAIFEFKLELGNEVHKYLLKSYPQTHMEILELYGCGYKIDSIDLNLRLMYMPFSIEAFKLYNYKIPKMIIPKDIARSVVSKTKHNMSLNIRKDLKTYNDMVTDLERWIYQQECMYEMIISKKTTLKSLVEIWPEAVKFKDIWEVTNRTNSEKLYKHPKCGIYSEEEIKRNINA